MRERVCVCLCNRYVSPLSHNCNDGFVSALCLYFYCKCGAKRPTDRLGKEWGEAEMCYSKLFHLFMLLCCSVAIVVVGYCTLRKWQSLLRFIAHFANCCFFYYLFSIYYALVWPLFATKYVYVHMNVCILSTWLGINVVPFLLSSFPSSWRS